VNETFFQNQERGKYFFNFQDEDQDQDFILYQDQDEDKDFFQDQTNILSKFKTVNQDFIFFKTKSKTLSH